jgi:hypothetical protein
MARYYEGILIFIFPFVNKKKSQSQQIKDLAILFQKILTPQLCWIKMAKQASYDQPEQAA